MRIRHLLLIVGIGLLALGLVLRGMSAAESVLDPARSGQPWLLIAGGAGVVLGLIGLARSSRTARN